MTNYLPIRKVAAAGVAFGITLALRALGVDLGPELVNEAALGVVTVGAAYLVKDPRVQAVEGKVEKLAAEHPAVAADLHAAAGEFLAQHAKAQEAADALYAKASQIDSSTADAADKVVPVVIQHAPVIAPAVTPPAK